MVLQPMRGEPPQGKACHLRVVVPDDLEVEEVVLVLSAQQSVQTSCQRSRQVLLEVISWRGERTRPRVRDRQGDRQTGQMLG